jgi:undecaprenyl-phosphate alpha-N-acetylglucosaminyl 1-phosphatetransferase
LFTSNFSLTPLLTAFITSAVFVFFACRMATAWGLLDRPDARKQHDGAVPLIGGLSIFIGSWMGLLVVCGWQKALWSPLLATFVIALIGLLDDRRPLPVLPRVLVQIAAMAVMIVGAEVWLMNLGDVVSVGPLLLPMWLGVPLTIVAVIGVINAVNMVDGIDGLAGSLTFMALATMGVMAWGAGRMLEAWVAILFATAIVPYLLCNLGMCGKKRRVFLGDAGSMLLGFVIAWLAIVLSQPSSVSQTPVFAPVTALWLFAIPLVDTVSIMLRRLLKGQSPFLPDRDHLHHIVLRMGYRDRHALLFIVLASVVLGGVGLWMEFTGVAEWKRFAAFMAFSALYFVILLKIWRVLKALRAIATAFRRVLWAVFSPLIVLSPLMKRTILLFVDGALIYSAFAAALVLRFDDWSAAARFFEGPLGLALIAAPLLAFPLFAWFGLYRAVVRFFGSQALWAVVGAVSLYALLYAGGWILLRMSGALAGLPSLPMGVIVMHAVLLVLGVGGSRMLGRRLLRQAGAADPLASRGMRAVIVGAGDAGRQLASVLQQGSANVLLGFVDDRVELFDRLLQGKPVLSPPMLEGFVEQHGVTDVLLADERLDDVHGRAQRNALLRQLSRLHVRVRRLPTFEALARGRVQWRDFQDLDVADLLQRDPVVLDSHALRAQLSRKTVLVLGAGGTIGSALCKQVLDFQPKLLLLYEVNELALHTVYQELLWQLQRLEKQRTASKLNDSGLRLMPRILPVLGSVQDGMRMQELMHTWTPDVVYHAAAYKHVPMVEHNPAEGLKNNVFGTLIAARAAMEAGVPNFVLISTDKAVRPTNIMGASKRFAEMSLQALASSPKVMFECLNESPIEIENRTHFSMVRFGNVLGSSGSVVPLFREQIQQGGPITLTDAEVTRYFMSIPEAAQLVMQAGALASGGSPRASGPRDDGGEKKGPRDDGVTSKHVTASSPHVTARRAQPDAAVHREADLSTAEGDPSGAEVFVLDMGEPVKILDLARRMVELSGLRVKDDACPQGDIEIEITGLRPGEKRYEELLIGDNPLPTAHPRILKAREEFLPWAELQPQLRALRIATDNNDIEAIRGLLEKLVVGYQPDPNVVDWVYLEQTASRG